MKIKQILHQHRRDFKADFECESCGFIEKNKSGYDDKFFHENVIPNMVCPNCGKTSYDGPYEYRPLTTKYSERYQI